MEQLLPVWPRASARSDSHAPCGPTRLGAHPRAERQPHNRQRGQLAHWSGAVQRLCVPEIWRGAARPNGSPSCLQARKLANSLAFDPPVLLGGGAARAIKPILELAVDAFCCGLAPRSFFGQGGLAAKRPRDDCKLHPAREREFPIEGCSLQMIKGNWRTRNP